MSLTPVNDVAVDTTALSFTFLTAKAAMEWQSKADREANAPRKPKTNSAGQPLYETHLLQVEHNGDTAYTRELVVNVPVDTTAIAPGSPVKVAGLKAHYWTSRDGKRSSFTFRCDSIAPVK